MLQIIKGYCDNGIIVLEQKTDVKAKPIFIF